MRFRDAYFMEALYFVLVAGCLLLLTSCSGASKELNRELEAEVQQQPPAKSSQELQQAGKEVLGDAKGLSENQRSKLRSLQTETTEKMTSLREEISKHQIVLMKHLVDPKSSNKAIDELKNRIVDLERQRTSTWLGALDKANKILGRRNKEDEQFYRALMRGPTVPDEQATQMLEN